MQLRTTGRYDVIIFILMDTMTARASETRAEALCEICTLTESVTPLFPVPSQLYISGS